MSPHGDISRATELPLRTRTIAGMVLGVVVVEGAPYSGPLITTRPAMEFNREVHPLPGKATQSASFGPVQLIKQGAKLVTGWEDLIEELPAVVCSELVEMWNR